MNANVKRRWFDPFIMPLLIGGMTLTLIGIMGEMLLGLYRPGDTPDRLDRPELWFALFAAILVIGGCGFLHTRPRGTTGILEKEVVIGKRAFFEAPLAPPDVRARSGELGTIADIAPGYTLYAQSGALAEVVGVLAGGEDAGKRFSGFLYASGLFGASPELWIPFEAVMSVYPETRSAFLAIKGDETEHFGWNVPPENVRRGPMRGVQTVA